MNKKERYYKFIVDDLVRTTEIDERNIIRHVIIPPVEPWLLIKYTHPNILNPNITKGIINKYGLRDDEVKIIWDIYRERIENLINNEQ